VNLRVLVGSGDQIGLLVLPFLLVGLILNILYPSFFSVGGPPVVVRLIAMVVLAVGIANWMWSATLILTKVPRKELIISGPYSIVKHPLYSGMALLVLPAIGVLLNSWLGCLIGFVLYVATRLFSVEEEVTLASTFGASWDNYCHTVKLPWL
jgi:protein-S-isoprenylcysteine O-methyltransferase Ste14